jgi:predicted DNA-binding protein (UPF0251 family)
MATPRRVPFRRRGIRPFFSDFPRRNPEGQKQIRPIHFFPETFRAHAYLIGMSTKALSVTPVSFEKVFAAPTTRRMLAQNWPSGEIAKDLTGWRAMAREALRRKKLGDTLGRAIGALSAKYREVLFLHDVKNLDTEETAWVLDMTAEAVRSRLLEARTQVRNALASALFPKHGEKNSRRGNSCAREFACDFQVPTDQNRSRKQKQVTPDAARTASVSVAACASPPVWA